MSWRLKCIRKIAAMYLKCTRKIAAMYVKCIRKIAAMYVRSTDLPLIHYVRFNRMGGFFSITFMCMNMHAQRTHK